MDRTLDEIVSERHVSSLLSLAQVRTEISTEHHTNQNNSEAVAMADQVVSVDVAAVAAVEVLAEMIIVIATIILETA